jgi:hypothetical protein
MCMPAGIAVLALHYKMMLSNYGSSAIDGALLSPSADGMNLQYYGYEK